MAFTIEAAVLAYQLNEIKPAKFVRKMGKLVEDYHTSAVLCCRGVYPRERLFYRQEDPVRTISFNAILKSVLTKLLTVLLTLLLLGRTSGRKNPRKHSVLGGADGTRTRELLRDRQMVILGKAGGHSSLT
jgi:hypothetical protein